MQITQQFGGTVYSEKINHWLTAHPGYKLVNVFPVMVPKVGGPEAQVIALFEDGGAPPAASASLGEVAREPRQR